MVPCLSVGAQCEKKCQKCIDAYYEHYEKLQNKKFQESIRLLKSYGYVIMNKEGVKIQ